MFGTPTMMLGGLGSSARHRFQGATPAGMGPQPWASYPGSGGPNAAVDPNGPSPDWRVNYITNSGPVNSPGFVRNNTRVFNGGVPVQGRPVGASVGAPIEGYALFGAGLGLGRTLVTPWRGNANAFTMGIRGLGSATSFAQDETLTVEELMATKPDDMAPCLRRVRIGNTSVSYATIWEYHTKLYHVLGAAVGVTHGWRRNKSIGWAAAWGVFGLFAPVLTTGVAIYQGLGAKRGR